MPRDGSGNYTVPPGTDGVPNATIGSSPYNNFVHDIESDQNTPRPILAGGTGAVNAPAALTNLGAVASTGGVMTGTLIINATVAPDIALNSNANGAINQVEGQRNSLRRWLFQMGDGAAETGGNVGSNFHFVGYDDPGSPGWDVFTVTRSTKKINMVQATDFSAVTKFLATASFVNAIGGIAINTVGGTAIPTSCGISVIYAGAGTQYGMVMRPGTDNTSAISFQNTSGTACGSISQTPTATAFNTSSDARLKENLKSFQAGNIIDDTNVYNFTWKAGGASGYGVIAQEAVEVYPDAVTYTEKEDWWGVDYSKYVPVLLQELKDLRARVAALEGSMPLQTLPA